MSFEAFSLKYRRINERVYSFGYDWADKPDGIMDKMHDNIAGALKRLNGDGDYVARFRFRVPEQSHLLPLFQRQLFVDLVDFHNKNSDKNSFVHPLTLMIFDPTLESISKDISSKRGTFENLKGEDAIHHELRHFLALQELWQSGAKGSMEFSLQWKKIKKSFALIFEGVFSNDEKANKDDLVYSFGAPLFPSSFDLKFIRKSSLAQKQLGKILSLIRYNFAKLSDQGSLSYSIFKPFPLNTEEMLDMLFYEWRKTRESTINFKIWDNIL